MKNLTDEIKLTIELMQGDIDDGAHGELQSHLYSLLEMKRNELQQRLVERAWAEPVTLGHHAAEQQPISHAWDGQDKCRRCGDRDWYASATCSPKQKTEPDVSALAEPAKPLTAEELKAGGWWCDDTSEDALKAFILFGLKDEGYTPWDGSYYGCFLYERGSDLLDRGYESHTEELKQIKRIGNEFYWSEE